jgi:hypothetical protein
LVFPAPWLRLTSYAVLWCALLCCAADLALVLHPLELQLILEQPHTTTAILQALGVLVAASHMKEVQKLRIDENITVLQDTMGGCER